MKLLFLKKRFPRLGIARSELQIPEVPLEDPRPLAGVEVRAGEVLVWAIDNELIAGLELSANEISEMGDGAVGLEDDDPRLNEAKCWNHADNHEAERQRRPAAQPGERSPSDPDQEGEG